MLSVVVPVYNIENYIEKCINSIIASSYKDIEIILVDDGSTDKSGEICDRFAAKDNRIKVIHKQNGGLVSARKAGVRIATGKFITFVDGDDFIHEELYMKLFERMADISSEVEMVAFNYKIVSEGEENSGQSNIICDTQNDLGIFDISDYCRLINDSYEIKIVNGVVAKIFITGILQQTIELVDDDITKAEDLAITLTYLPSCRKVILAEDVCGYYYVQRDSSISHLYDDKSIEKAAAFINCVQRYALKEDIPVIWKKVIFNEGYSIIMSDCVGCCFKHFGKLRLISILRFFHAMCSKQCLREFYQIGIDKNFFSSIARIKYAKLMTEGHYVLAFMQRVKKNY